MKLVSVWLTDEQYEELRVRSFESKKSRSEFIRDFIFGPFKEI